ncbi:hypothetical protein BH11PSE9_BH11PSE9_06090 [soil metagenome]
MRFLSRRSSSCPTFVPLAFAALAATLASTARADAPPPQGVVSLQSSASIEVTKDLLNITMNTSRDGADANLVQSQLKQALDAALAEAKKAAKPGQVDVRTGNFSIYPRYNAKGGSNGWQGSAELVIEGRDLQAIAQLAGRITTLTIARVAYNLSRELREKSESDVTGQAIAAYRAKAAEYTKQFGYTSYTIREVNVNANEQGGVMPMAYRAKAMSAASADEALPIEAGKGTVVVTVNGTVQMSK